MIDLVRAVRVEILKLRRTLALWVAILVPLLLLILIGAVTLSRDVGIISSGQTNTWDILIINMTLFIWCIIGLPLFVALETALLASLEHRENAWKHLLALPIPRWSVYAAKLVVAGLLVIISSLVLVLGIGLEGTLVHIVRPDLGLDPPVPWDTIFQRVGTFTPASLLMLTIQSWVATRWRSFPIAVGLGIAGTVAGLVLSMSQRSANIAALFPWSMSFLAMSRPEANALPDTQIVALSVGIIGGLVVGLFGCIDISRRDVL